MNTGFGMTIERGGPSRPSRAQAMAEFAFTILLLIGVFIAITDGARWIATRFALANAAAAGARPGAFRPTPAWDAANIDAQVRTATRSVLPPWVTLADADIAVYRVTTSTPLPCTVSEPETSP